MQEYTLYLRKEQQFFRSEIESLIIKVDHIKKIMIMQETLKNKSSNVEMVNINKLIDDSLIIMAANFEKGGIQIEKNYNDIPLVEVDKVKTIQTIINLIKNAKDAVKKHS